MHFIWVIFLLVVAWRGFGNFFSKEATAAASDRLDIVATALAVLGVVVGVAAIGGFLIVRREAIEAAQIEAKAQIPRLVTEYLEVTHPETLQNAITVAVQVNPYPFLQAIRAAFGIDESVGAAEGYGSALSTKEPPDS